MICPAGAEKDSASIRPSRASRACSARGRRAIASPRSRDIVAARRRERNPQPGEQRAPIDAARHRPALDAHPDRPALDGRAEIARIGDVALHLVAPSSRSGIGKATVMVTGRGDRLRKT